MNDGYLTFVPIKLYKVNYACAEEGMRLGTQHVLGKTHTHYGTRTCTCMYNILGKTAVSAISQDQDEKPCTTLNSQPVIYQKNYQGSQAG